MLADGFREGDYVYEINVYDGKGRMTNKPMSMQDKGDFVFGGIWRYRPVEKDDPLLPAGEQYGEKKTVAIFHKDHGLEEEVQVCGQQANGKACIWRREDHGAVTTWLASNGWEECEVIVGEEAIGPRESYRAIRVLVIEGTKEFVRETLKRSVIDAEIATAFIEQGGTVSYRSTKFEKVLEIEEAELGE